VSAIIPVVATTSITPVSFSCPALSEEHPARPAATNPNANTKTVNNDLSSILRISLGFSLYVRDENVLRRLRPEYVLLLADLHGYRPAERLYRNDLYVRMRIKPHAAYVP